MPKSSRPDHLPQLHTATAIGDPILARLDSPEQKRTTVLLADDATYEQANIVVLHNVRWSQFAGRIPFSFNILREPAIGFCEELRIHKVGDRYVAKLGETSGRLALLADSALPFISLSNVQYQTLRSATPRRLQMAGRAFLPLMPRRAFQLLAPGSMMHAIRRALCAAKSSVGYALSFASAK
jgi:hypothetical protein